MTEAADGRLAEVTADTLEKLAFLFATPMDAPPSLDESQLSTVRVEFGGAFTGGMELSLSGPVLDELAVNMLGADDGDPIAPEARLDALKELANVVCGNLLPTLGGGEAVFNIQAPVVVPAGHPAWADCAASCGLALDQGVCRVRLRLEPDVAGAPPTASR
jgi:hypothetical protein